MSLTDYAREELDHAGLLDDDSDYGGMIGRAVLELVEVFASQCHSGASAEVVLEAFKKVASFEPLSPLTYEPDEWFDRSEESGSPMWQNRRDPRVFSFDKGATHYRV